MKQFTLYSASGEFIDQIQVFGDDSAQPPAGWVETTGQTFDAEVEARKRIAPVTRRQMLTALHRAGLLTVITQAVEASGDVELQIAFSEAQEFSRSNAFLAAMAQALGKTDAEIDAVFHLAATL